MKLFRAIVAAALLVFAPAINLAQEATAAPGEDPRIDGLVEVLKDERVRQQLIERLQRSDSPTETQTPVGSAPAEAQQDAALPEEDAVFQGGLLTGMSKWFSELGQRLPTAALGTSLDVKLVQAEAQIQRRLAPADAISKLRDFGLRSAIGWGAVTAGALAALYFAKSRIRRSVPRGAKVRTLGIDVAARVGFALLPVGVATGVAWGWAVFASYSEFERSIFVLLAVPFAFMLTTSGVAASLLVLLAPSKGARVVAYAQRKLAPLLGVLVGISIVGSVTATPEIRNAIGPATGDLLSLAFDLAVPIFAGIVLVLHRRTVRSLIVRGHSVEDGGSMLDRAIHWIGTNWQYFGFAFVILNIGARVFGTRSSNFLTQSTVSVVLIILAFIAVTSIKRFEGTRERAAKRRARTGVRSAISARLAGILYRGIQIGAVLLATVFCLGLWGIDAGQWLGSPAGLSVIRPVASIVLVMLVAWVLWVVLDAWIGAVLTPALGSLHRERSARVKTLLPLLRNVAFVVLSVLTVIGVLSNLGINVAPLIAGAGVVGLAVGFGSQELVKDVITGLFILLEDTLAIGEVVDTGDRAGTVEALTIRTMKIRDGEGALHSVPFSTVKALKNSSRGYGVYIVGVTLAFDADVEAAIEAFREVGDEVRREPQFQSRILSPLEVWGVDQVGPDGIVIKGAIRTLPLQQYGVGREINRRLNARFHKQGIALASRNAVIDRQPEAVSA